MSSSSLITSEHQATPIEAREPLLSTSESRALRLKGKDCYEYLLNRMTRELVEKYEKRSEVEATMYSLPNTCLHESRRRELKKNLKEFEEYIKEAQNDIEVVGVGVLR